MVYTGMPSLRDCLRLDGHDPDLRLFVNGTSDRVLIAIGCSWTRAWGWYDHDLHSNDPNRKDDVDFMCNDSFVGILSQYLGCSGQINTAIPGSNNDMQTRLLVEIIERNRNNLGEIFVLWGITSHLRWELWSTIVKKPTMFMLGSKGPPHKELEKKWYFTYHYDESFEMTRLSQKIITMHGYLKNLKIQHLFFPVFTNCNQQTMQLDSMAAENFYLLDQHPNSMLNLMFDHVGQPGPSQWLSNPYNTDDNDQIRCLQRHGLMSKLAHPSRQGHRFIGEKLIGFIDNMGSGF